MEKSIEKAMHLGVDFWEDVAEFSEEKSKHVGSWHPKPIKPLCSLHEANKQFLRGNYDFEGSGSRSLE